jgi:Nucleotidyl transferase AbiEii toxin, Type IV TA system
VSFIHDDPEFDDLLRIVAGKRKLSLGLVEKDYWVTHTLWALHAAGFEIWFKGGTSLSKGFGLIERFSEDLALKIEPGSVTALPAVSNWKSESTKATAGRKAHFEQLAALLKVPGARVSLDTENPDPAWRNADIRVAYSGRHLGDLRGMLRPFVLLEIGSARVTPSAACDMTSFVHDELAAQGQLGPFADNRPKAVRCVHPIVTLLEKLDALHRRMPNEKAEPASFVRHFEDAAKVIYAQSSLPPLSDYEDARALAADMLRQKQIAAIPSAADPAFALAPGARTVAVQAAHAAITPMFWGPRIALDEACASIRGWIESTLTNSGPRDS